MNNSSAPLTSTSHPRYTDQGVEPVAEPPLRETDMSQDYESAMKMWAVSGDSYFPCERTEAKMPPGQYVVHYDHNRGIFFEYKEVNLDELITLPDNNSEKVIKSMAEFWKKEDIFREYGFLWKRGIMLWGPPGSGKTSTVQQLSKQIIGNGGISLYCTEPSVDADGLRILRKIEPNRPIVVIMEDIDAIIERFGEASLLAMLDGELQVDNVVFVATTNYPERLDKRFSNRPSRFDEVIQIGMPSDECRETYIKHKNPRLIEEEGELARWVRETEDFSIAHIKELVVSVECLGNNFDDVIARLKKMNEESVSSINEGRRAGFL